jgi:hypothetical protein
LEPGEERSNRLLVQPVSPGHLPQTNVLGPSLPTQIWDDQLPSVSRGRHHEDDGGTTADSARMRPRLMLARRSTILK